jgi:hypothetical protein
MKSTISAQLSAAWTSTARLERSATLCPKAFWRHAIFTGDTHDKLDRMRAFRHRERNSCGFGLDGQIVLERAREVIQAYDALAADVRRFLAAQTGTMPKSSASANALIVA